MRGLIGTTMIALGVAGVLQAQEPEKRRANSPPPPPPPAKAARPRVGTAATPALPPVPVQIIQPTVYYSPDGYVTSGGQFLALSDGSVLVNFGNGYERVLRSCSQPTTNAAQAERNATGRDALGRILPPPGIAALQAGSRGQILGNTPARNAQACFRTDGRGRTEVVTTGQ